MRAACAGRARAVRASCAGHSSSAPATRCALVDLFNTCALYALCMRTAYVQHASNTLCMRCQLASFFRILTKVRRTTTHWPYFSFFYARTVRRVGVTGPLRCTLASRGSSRSLHNSMRAAFAVVLMGSVHLMKLFRDFRRGTTPRCPLSGCLSSVVCRVRSVRLIAALLMRRLRRLWADGWCWLASDNPVIIR